MTKEKILEKKKLIKNHNSLNVKKKKKKKKRENITKGKKNC